MNHRKVRSQGSVPFSWEEKPGVSKFTPKNSNTSQDKGHTTLYNILSDNFDERRPIRAIKSIPVPPPPCTSSQPPRRRSFTMKGNWWQDDPFLAALKACTKGVTRNQKGEGEGNRMKGVNGNNYKYLNGRNTKNSVFSCKESCEVANDNFARSSSFPSLPRERYKAKPFVKCSQ